MNHDWRSPFTTMESAAGYEEHNLWEGNFPIPQQEVLKDKNPLLWHTKISYLLS